MRNFFRTLFAKKPGTTRNTPTDTRTRLGMTSLESREVPAYLSGGVLFIDGSNAADSVTVSETTVYSRYLPPREGVRVTENGSSQTFLRQLITNNRVEFRGFGGNDYFDNDVHSLTSKAWGGDGDDQLHGANGTDFLYGEDGNDTLGGGGGEDYLYGGLGDDTMHGHSGDDYMSGSSGNDVMDGGSGNDSMYGGSGNDRMYGQSGDDYMSGSSGNDFLNGSTGVDRMYGGSGNDGLLGGPGDEGDTVTGNSGQDRFLDWTDHPFGWGETRTDVSNEDAVVFFRNTGPQTVLLGSNVGWVNYSSGSWTGSQIESADNAFVQLQDETGNTRLLKTSGGGALTFNKAGTPDNSGAATVGGWNSGGGNITLTNFAMSSDSNIRRVAIHEIAHNWDTESPMYNQWLTLSGWQQHIPGVHDIWPPAGKVKSGDGMWWHDADADFARNYGKMNPLEDFATSWEAYFGLNGTQVSAKMTHIEAFMDSIDALG